MKNYRVFIKSHCELPDYEDEIRASSHEEAAKIFTNKINFGLASCGVDDFWTVEAVAENVICPDDFCPECNTELENKIELRTPSYFENVSYCNGCGYTGIQK